MSIKISLAGDVGSGKSTVSAILVERLGATYYSTGAICREVAASHGMSVVEMNVYMETHPELDHEIDDGVRALAYRKEDLIIDSRMAFHFVEGSFRVYMATQTEESARRIMKAGRATEQFATFEDAVAQVRTRKASERKRYSDLYGVDCKDLSNYDLVVDTTFASPEEVACCIIDALKEWEEDKTKRACFVCPRRFLYPDDAPDFSRVEKLSALLDEGMEDVGTVEAVESDGTFYATGNVEVALAYSLSDVALVPTRLTVGNPPRGTFVPMADNL